MTTADFIQNRSEESSKTGRWGQLATPRELRELDDVSNTDGATSPQRPGTSYGNVTACPFSRTVLFRFLSAAHHTLRSRFRPFFFRHSLRYPDVSRLFTFSLHLSILFRAVLFLHYHYGFLSRPSFWSSAGIVCVVSFLLCLTKASCLPRRARRWLVEASFVRVCVYAPSLPASP